MRWFKFGVRQIDCSEPAAGRWGSECFEKGHPVVWPTATIYMTSNKPKLNFAAITD